MNVSRERINNAMENLQISTEISDSSDDDEYYVYTNNNNVICAMKDIIQSLDTSEDFRSEIDIRRMSIERIGSFLNFVRKQKLKIDFTQKQKAEKCLLDNMSKVVGLMTQMTLRDMRLQPDEQLTPKAYKCSLAHRHNRISRKRHHHDLRRRKDRRRRRKRKQQKEEPQEASSVDESDIEVQKYHQRRKQWRDIKERTELTSPPPPSIPTKVHLRKKIIKEDPIKINKPKISINLSSTSVDLGGPVITKSPEYSVNFPYPVIDDERDLDTVSRAIQSKKREVELRLNDTVFQLNTQAETQPSGESFLKLQESVDNIRAQVRRMDTQLDYVQTRKEIERIKATPCKSQKEKEESKKQLSCLISRVGRLHQSMKEANRQYLKTTSVQQPPPPMIPIKEKRPKANSSVRNLATIKSKITDLIQGNKCDLQPPAPKKRKEAIRQEQPDHKQFMKMLDEDEKLKACVRDQISSLATDDPVMRVLSAEAQKRLGTVKIENNHDIDERHLSPIREAPISDSEQDSEQSSEEMIRPQQNEQTFVLSPPPTMTCSLFEKKASTIEESNDSSGLYWAMNEIGRMLSKLDRKYIVIGGPYNGRFIDRCSGGAPFGSLSSLLYTECD